MASPVNLPAEWNPAAVSDDLLTLTNRLGEPARDLVILAEGNTSELVNYRVRGHHMIVDRLFAAAELRFGSGREQKRVRIVRTDGRPTS